MALSRSVKSTVISVLSALPLVAFSAVAALAEPIQFTLNRVLEQFYASPPNVASWEEDILGADVLLPGESAVITIDDGRSDCLYDIKGVLGPAPGVGRGELIQSAVYICDGSTYQYSN